MDVEEILEGHRRALYENFRTLRNESTDFIVEVEGIEIRVHKFVLALHSDYFRAMLASKATRESLTNRVKIESVTKETMSMLLDFCYSQPLNLNEDNVLEMLVAANRFQFKPVQDICIVFVEEHMNRTNCLEIATVAYLYQLPSLLESSLELCAWNFKFLVEQEELLTIEADLLTHLISQESLNIHDELEVFQAISRWFCCDKQNRHRFLGSLVGHVRFAHINPISSLEELKKTEIFQLSEECKNLVDKAIKYTTLPETPALRAIAAPRFFNLPRKIYAIGGLDEGHLNFCVEVYDPSLDRWAEIIEDSVLAKCDIQAVIVGSSIFAFGCGYSSINRFDLLKRKWFEQQQDVDFGTHRVSVVVHKNEIYVLGVVRGGTSWCFKKYLPSPRFTGWTDCNPPRGVRKSAKLVSLGSYIYLLGGRGSDSSVLNTVERYDPIKRLWTCVSSMKTERASFGCATLGGKIYVAGGWRDLDNSRLKAAECYDPTRDAWHEIAPMDRGRNGFGLVEAGGLIYALGGSSGYETDVVEAYDSKSDEWLKRKSMKRKRWAAAYV